jgi:hypothetical protein
MLELDQITYIFHGTCFKTPGKPRCTVVATRHFGIFCSVCGDPNDN